MFDDSLWIQRLTWECNPLVIAIDNSPLRLALARHNATIYDVEDRIEFVSGDYISFAKKYRRVASSEPSEADPSQIGVVFLSTPWGGPAYLTNLPTKEHARPPLEMESAEEPSGSGRRYTLDMMAPISGDELIELTHNITHDIAFFLPRNTALH